MKRHAAAFWQVARARASLPRDSVTLALLATLVIGGLYDIYRYPLRINARITSPTYADTPLALSIGKYAAIALVTLAAARRAPAGWRRVAVASPRQRALAALTLWLLAIGVYHSLRAGGVAPFRSIAPVLCVLPLALLLDGTPGGDRGAGLGRLWRRLAASLVLLHTCFNLAEIALWLTTGRLPALGYSGSLVRFGGVWDDPNSCAAFSSLFLVYCAARPRRFGRGELRVLVVCAALNLVVAWSFSAVIILLAGLLGVGLQGVRRKGLLLAGAALAAGLTLATLPLFSDASARLPVIGGTVQQKLSGSIRSRQTALSHGAYFADLPSNPGAWLIGRDAAQPNEAAPVWWVSASGLIGAALAALWVALCARAVWRTPQRDWALPAGGALLLGSLFVPYVVTFPLGAFFFLGLAALAAYAAPTTSAEESARSEPIPAAAAAGLPPGPAAFSPAEAPR